jgi:hypothetical protein
LSARLLPNILGHTHREIRVCFLPLLRSDHGHCTAPPARGAVPGPSIHAVPAQSASIRESDWHVAGDGCARALVARPGTGEAPPERARLLGHVVADRFDLGILLPRARGIASPSPAKPCPGNTDGVVASGHRRIDETSVCQSLQRVVSVSRTVG